MAASSRHFEATEEELEANIDRYVDDFINGLQSFFLVMPKGADFVEFPRFQSAYRILERQTRNFSDFSSSSALAAVQQDPLVLVVLRVMTGLSPPELAHLATAIVGVPVDQSNARRLDKRARTGHSILTGVTPLTRQRVSALVSMAVRLLDQGVPLVGEGAIHRLDKIDTQRGIESLRELALGGVPYPALLYERFLGRPFATHRDTISEQVGDLLEEAVTVKLQSSGITYYKVGRAERFEDMDQGPDFFVPDQFHPAIVIEAKLAEDDGTARDKVTRIQHLAELREQRKRLNDPSFELIACVDGRGFGIRREDVKKLLIATKGKLFSLQTIDNISQSTGLRGFSHPL